MHDNKSALLKGARLCLDQQGYARTTARDVASAAGVSTAAIGYHFGTTDSLLVTALFEGLTEWSRGFEEQLSSVSQPLGPGDIADVYVRLGASLPKYRGLLAASFELLAQSEQKPTIASQLREMVAHARKTLARTLFDPASQLERSDATAIETYCYALMSGLIVQWLVDPGMLPSRDAVATELERLQSR